MANMEKIADKLAILPAQPGCYLMKNKGGDIIYVGKAKVLKNRVRQYFVGAHDFKTTRLVANIDDFEYIVTASEKEALLLEINLIKKHTPPYNIMFMDDKTYPYLKLSKEAAPRLEVVRNTKDKKADYFGPFPDSGAAYDMAKLLNRMYPLRKCRQLPKKECLYYHIGQCLGPCIRPVDEAVYAQMRNEIRRFLKGDVSDTLAKLNEQMLAASEQLQFERAQEIHELMNSIRHVVDKQQIDFKDHLDRDVFAYYVDKGYISIQGFFMRGGKLLERSLSVTPLYEEEMEAFVAFIAQYYAHNPLPNEILIPREYDAGMLRELYGEKIVQPQRGDKVKLVEMALRNAKNAHEQKFTLVERKDQQKQLAMGQLSRIFQKEIHRIEIFDNSHLASSSNVSGMVVFLDGEPHKPGYRLYRLGEYRSDMDSMREVLYRRYFRLLKEGAALPDLLVVDGGYQQVEAAKEIREQLDLDLTICGLVKDEHHNTSNLMDDRGRSSRSKKKGRCSFFWPRCRMRSIALRSAITAVCARRP